MRTEAGTLFVMSGMGRHSDRWELRAECGVHLLYFCPSHCRCKQASHLPVCLYRERVIRRQIWPGGSWHCRESTGGVCFPKPAGPYYSLPRFSFHARFTRLFLRLYNFAGTLTPVGKIRSDVCSCFHPLSQARPKYFLFSETNTLTVQMAGRALSVFEGLFR